MLIVTYMVISSSSAYGNSFHDNGDGYDNKNNFFTPGKRKSTRDDGDDGNDNGARRTQRRPRSQNDPQRPMQDMVWTHSVMASRTGRTGAAVGTASKPPPTRRRPATRAKVPRHRMSRCS